MTKPPRGKIFLDNDRLEMKICKEKRRGKSQVVSDDTVSRLFASDRR